MGFGWLRRVISAPTWAAGRNALADYLVSFVERSLHVGVAVIAVELIAPDGPAIAPLASEQFEERAGMEAMNPAVGFVWLLAVRGYGRNDDLMMSADSRRGEPRVASRQGSVLARV